MLLSDTLQMTVSEIERCLAAHPECYGPMAKELLALREQVDDVRNAMDQHSVVSGQEDMLRTAGKS